MPNKYKYLLVIQHSYAGMPWEDCCEYDTADTQEKSAARFDLREYKLSSLGDRNSVYRMIRRREVNK